MVKLRVEARRSGEETSNATNSVVYLAGYVLPSHMVRALVLRKLRMRKPNTNKAVPLDVVPERRTKRCSPRFRPGGRFCGLSFRYLSPGIEGEKCRPLDHM